MEISAVSITPDIIKWSNADTIFSNESREKKQLVSQQNQNELVNKKDEQVSAEEIAKALEKINRTLALHNTRLVFSIHDKTNEILVKVMDEKTGEVIREVPSEKALDMVAMSWEEIGLIVDEKA